MSEIDWNVELRKVEREFDGLPPALSPAEVRAKLAAEREELRKQNATGNAVVTWARLLLVVSLIVALKSWPYARDCGLGLFAYVATEVVILVGALWVATCTWRHRMAKTHALAMMLVLGALGLLEIEILPRVGYATISGAKPVRVRCAD